MIKWSMNKIRNGVLNSSCHEEGNDKRKYDAAQHYLVEANRFDPLVLHHQQVSQQSNCQGEIEAAYPDVNVKKMHQENTSNDSNVVGHGEKELVGNEV